MATGIDWSDRPIVEIAEMYEVPLEDVRTILAYAEQYRLSAHSVR